MPEPCFKPLTHSPSQDSPLGQVQSPTPSGFPFTYSPWYTLPFANISYPLPCLQSHSQCPSQTRSLLQIITPEPCLRPLTIQPQYAASLYFFSFKCWEVLSWLKSMVYDRGIYSLNCLTRFQQGDWLITERTLDQAMLGQQSQRQRDYKPRCSPYFIDLYNQNFIQIYQEQLTQPSACPKNKHQVTDLCMKFQSFVFIISCTCCDEMCFKQVIRLSKDICIASYLKAAKVCLQSFSAAYFMANCHSIPYSELPSNNNSRALSSNARLTNSIPNQSPQASRRKDKKRQQRCKYNGLSASDILLYYLQTQANYRLSDHQFYPNIVIYYNETQTDCGPNTQDVDMESTSEIKNSSILDQNADPNQYPYNCLGIITGKDSSSLKSINKVGTGCLVSPCLVLTSASLVTQQKTGLLLKDLTFLPKASSAHSKSQQSIRIIDVKLPLKYFRTYNDSSQDYALLLLEHSIKRQKYIYIGYDMSKESKAQLYGYQLGLIQLNLHQQTYRQLGVKGKILQIYQQMFVHSIPTRKTCIGAPIIVEYTPGFIFTVGIFSNNQQRDSACRITAKKVQNLKKWAKELTGKEFNITTVKMVDFTMKKAQVPNDFTTLTHQIAQIQQLVDFQHQNGPTDQLRYYLGKLGELCWKNGEFNRSIINLQEGLRICNELYKPQSQQYSFFYSNLGLNYQKLKQYDLAFRNFQLALKINKRKGERTLGVAIAYNNIGNIYKRKENYQKALKCFNRSLDIKREVCGQRSEGVAASLSNIALLDWQKKNYQQAVRLYKDSLSIYRQVFGQSHFQISRTLYNLALCYYDIQQYDQWLDLHYQSLSIMQKLKMVQHPSYFKRKKVLTANLLEVIHHSSCSSQLVLKSITIVSTLFSKEQAKEITHELQLKIASFK